MKDGLTKDQTPGMCVKKKRETSKKKEKFEGVRRKKISQCETFFKTDVS